MIQMNNPALLNNSVRILIILTVCLGCFSAAAGRGSIGSEDVKSDSADIIYLPGIVVKADRIPLTFFRIPYSADVLRIDRNRPEFSFNMVQTIGSIPGIRAYPTGNKWGEANADIRGFYGGGESQYLMVTLDGIPLNDASTGLVEWNDYDILNLGRIETVRGPVSAQFGDFGFGGLVAFHTAPYLRQKPVRLTLEVGSDEALLINGRLTRVADENGVSASFTRKQNGGWREHSQYNSAGLFIDFKNRLKNNASLNGVFSYNHTTEEHPGALTRAALDMDRESSAMTLTGQPTPDEDECHKVLAGLSSDINIAETVELKPQVNLKYSTSRDIVTITNPVKHSPDIFEFGADLALGAKDLLWNRKFNLVGGASFDYGHLKTRYRDVDENYEATSLISGGTGERINLSFYFQGIYHFNNQVFASFGGRYDNIQTKYRGDSSAVSIEGTDDSQDGQSFTPKISVGISPHENLSFYASLAGAFKAPTLRHLYDSPPFYNSYAGQYILISNHELESQTGICSEVGFRAKGSGSLSVNVNLFNYLIKDEIDFDESFIRYDNIGKSHHYGVETSVSRKLWDKFHGNMSLIYNASKFRIGPFEGNQINGVPEITYNIKLEYRFRPDGYLALAANGLSRQYLDQANTQRLNDYVCLSLLYGVAIEGFNLHVTIDNLLNTEYEYSGYIDPLINEARFYPAAKTTIGMTFSYEL